MSKKNSNYIFEQWYTANKSNPYPSQDIIKDFAKKSGNILFSLEL